MPNPDELFELLQDAEDRDQLATARALYEALLVIDPEQASLLVLFGANLIELGDLATAERILERAQEYIDEETEVALLTQQGNLARAKGDYPTAEKLFRDAHKLNPTDAENLLNAAAMSVALGQPPRAEHLLREAVKLEDEFYIDSLFNLAGLLVSLQRYPEAKTCYQKILNKEPDHELAEEWLIDLEQMQSLDLSFSDED